VAARQPPPPQLLAISSYEPVLLTYRTKREPRRDAGGSHLLSPFSHLAAMLRERQFTDVRACPYCNLSLAVARRWPKAAGELGGFSPDYSNNATLRANARAAKTGWRNRQANPVRDSGAWWA